MKKVKWLDEPEDHDFAAALDYLSLVMSYAEAVGTVRLLRGRGKLSARKAKDILRASGLELLPEGNKHVAADLAKIGRGEKLSPVLLVANVRGALVVADGYHRVCASYWTDENTDIPCALAWW